MGRKRFTRQDQHIARNFLRVVNEIPPLTEREKTSIMAGQPYGVQPWYARLVNIRKLVQNCLGSDYEAELAPYRVEVDRVALTENQSPLAAARDIVREARKQKPDCDITLLALILAAGLESQIVEWVKDSKREN